jgi:hypothetical protein
MRLVGRFRLSYANVIASIALFSRTATKVGSAQAQGVSG